MTKARQKHRVVIQEYSASFDALVDWSVMTPLENKHDREYAIARGSAKTRDIAEECAKAVATILDVKGSL